MKNYFKDKDAMRQVFVLATAGVIVVAFFMLIANISVVADFLWSLVDILMPFIWGIILYLLLANVCRFIEKMLPDKVPTKYRRYIGTFGSVIFLVLIITIFLIIIVPQLISSAAKLAGNMNTYINDLTDWLLSLDLSYLFTSDTINTIERYATSVINELVNILMVGLPSIVNAAYSTIGGVISFVIGVIIYIYIMLDRESIHGQFMTFGKALMKESHIANISTVLAKSVEKFNRFIRGQLIDAMILGILVFVGMSILRLDYAVLISCVCAITNVIPVFGPFIGAIPSAFILLMIDPYQCLIFIIMIIVLQQIDGNIIYPKVMGDSIGLGKIWIMFAIIVGGGLFGIVGMFFGVPVFSIVYYFLSGYARLRVKNKESVDSQNE